MSDLLIARYFDLLLYQKLKADFLKTSKEAIYSPSPDFTQTTVQVAYDRMLFCSQDLMLLRNSVFRGLTTPALALWRDSEPKIMEGAYGRSVLRRDFIIPAGPGGVPAERYAQAPLVDWEFDYHIYAESYYAPFVSKVAQDFTQFDMVRYAEFDMSDYVYGLKTRAELRMGQVSRSTIQLESESSTRNFRVDIPFTMRVSVPIMGSDWAIDKLIVTLNGMQVFSIG